MIKKSFFSKVLLIFFMVNSSSMLSGMELVLSSVVAGLNFVSKNDFAKQNYHHIFKLGIGIGLVYFYSRVNKLEGKVDSLKKLVESHSVDILQTKIEEVRRLVKRLAKEHNVKIDSVLKKIEKLPTVEKLKELNKLLENNLQASFKEGADELNKKFDVQLKTINENHTVQRDSLVNLTDKFQTFQTGQKVGLVGINSVKETTELILANQQNNVRKDQKNTSSEKSWLTLWRSKV